MREQAEEYRNILVEAVAENDEALMEKYLEGEEITREELKAAIRKETIANTLVPVVCGSSYKNRGGRSCWTLSLTISRTYRCRGHQGCES